MLQPGQRQSQEKKCRTSDWLFWFIGWWTETCGVCKKATLWLVQFNAVITMLWLHWNQWLLLFYLHPLSLISIVNRFIIYFEVRKVYRILIKNANLFCIFLAFYSWDLDTFPWKSCRVWPQSHTFQWSRNPNLCREAYVEQSFAAESNIPK